MDSPLNKRTQSILTELDRHRQVKDKDHFVESKAANLIEGAINLMRFIRENYDSETAQELERRFLNSIRGQDSAKFTRGIKKVKATGNETP